MNKKTLMILEIAWIIIGLICIYAAFHNKTNEGGNRYLVFAGMAVVAFIMAAIRHFQRKKE